MSRVASENEEVEEETVVGIRLTEIFFVDLVLNGLNPKVSMKSNFRNDVTRC